MNKPYLTLSASIAVALASAPGFLLAAPASISSASASTAASRVTETVSSSSLFTVPKTHLGFVSKATTATPVNDSVKMNHLQLILKPSASQTALMEATIANQHDPKSAQFHHWLTPAQFGAQFGVADSDIAAVTSWLVSQGFTVNAVYPNKTQIDFSGTAAQVRQAFHTQENIYTINNVKHLSNSSDISIPSALKSVVAGVMGLNDFHPTALAKKPEVAQWSASKKGFVSKSKPSSGAITGQAIKGQAINFSATERGLVPNDMATIYGIRTLRANGVTGAGINIAVVEDADMVPADWTNFVSVFNLGQFNGTFQQINPAAPTGTNNCNDPSVDNFGESGETVLDAEWSTAIAPAANIWVSTCSDYTADFSAPSTDNFFGGVFLAASNLINAPSAANRPDIISASYGFGEYFTDAASKTAIDLMWAQADAEGISVFVSTGDSGSNPSFNGGIINGYQGNTAVDANSFATSAHDTAVGGTDFSDVLKGTTSTYFAPTPSAVGGSALSYVPEIPWNNSCGNGVAATANGFSSAVAFCQQLLKYDPDGYYVTSEAASGGASSVDAKPVWQRQILNAAHDQSRDLPDVALFGGAYGGYSWVIVCTSYYPCTPDFSGPTALSAGTSFSSPMFAGIQALIDQGLTRNGLPADQGNAAPTLYALAGNEYGTASGATPSSLDTCNANNGATGTAACVFHNVTTGTISSQCYQETTANFSFTTANCYYYGSIENGAIQIGLTSTLAAPTSYSPTTKAYPAGPGWSFASGLGSVNATNLLIAWRAFVGAKPAPAPTVAAK